MRPAALYGPRNSAPEAARITPESLVTKMANLTYMSYNSECDCASAF
jgi:hypothetical protein